MAAQGERPPGAFPLLVRGTWGSAEPPAALRNKLLCYFQSQKRSGGGECELREGPAPGSLLLCFARRDVRQRVLERQNHELNLGENGKLNLIVKEVETDTEEETSEEKLVPTKENSKYEAAGACRAKESFAPDTELQERSCSVENVAECSTKTLPLVALENVQHLSTEGLCRLLENTSGLGVYEDFCVEMIPEKSAAVLTLFKSIDAQEFVKFCAENKQLQKFKITARLLELTPSIKAENLPAGISTDRVTEYFENVSDGAGPVVDVKLLPKERSAIIIFSNPKDLSVVLEKQHSLEQTPISVYPYYHCLGTALYGENRPSVKMPEPFSRTLDPYVWQFLQKQDKLIQDINQEMATCHCDVIWPQTDCTHPEMTLYPSSSLSEQNEPMIRLIKTWKQDTSARLLGIMSRYTAIKCQVNPACWEDVKARLVNDDALIVMDAPEFTVMIAGTRATVSRAEKEVRECMEKAMEEREKQEKTIEMSVPVMPGKYAVLHSAGLEEDICKEYPHIKIFYDYTKEALQLCGLPVEVCKIKMHLLEKVQNMPSKSVNVTPQVFQFLRCVDNKTMSERLFSSKKIKAFYELENGTVVLFGNSPKDLSDAEKQIQTDLDYKCVDLEDSEIIKKDEWRNLIDFSYKKYNYSQKTITIEEPFGKENIVTITGFSKAVAEVYQFIFYLVDKNTSVEKRIPAKSGAVVQFVEQEKNSVCLEIEKKGVQVCFDTKTPCISLSGPKPEVAKAGATLEQIVSLLCCKSVPIDKPGAKEIFMEKKDLHVLEVKQKYNCLIMLEIEEQEQKGGEVVNKGKRELCYEETLKDGVKMLVCKGNLYNYRVDIVVNVLNEDSKLTHDPAGRLLQEAGPDVQREYQNLVKTCGHLKPGRVVVTSAGRLPCKHVIHAGGPNWRKRARCLHHIKKIVKNSIQEAKVRNHHSIALPFIRAGILGFPMELCAQSIVSSLKKTLEESGEDSSLREVHLVGDADATVQVLRETVKQMVAAKSPFEPLLPQPFDSHSLKEGQKAERKENLQMVTTNEGLCIKLEKGSIQDATTDVIVNSIGVDLQLGMGPLCRALLQKAGPELQLEFDREKRTQAAGKSTVFLTSGYNLLCKTVLHAVVPIWDGGSGEALKTLKEIINFCLHKTEELALNSITFPAIGTGGFGFPKSTVAKLMFDTVFEFSSHHSPKTLREVHFLLFPKDTANIQAFTSELDCRVAENRIKAAPQHIFIGPVVSDSQGVHEMKIGSITLQLINGDITREDTDVIVNITSPAFNANSGLFKAIMDAAGSEVKRECDQYAWQLQSGFVTTEGGNLLCKKIIHLIHSLDIKKQVTQVLQECEHRMYTSVAFPAIGTGQAKQSPAKVADNMLDAIIEFARQKTLLHLKIIKIVIFETQMNSEFYESMKKRRELNAHNSDRDESKLTPLLFGKKKSTKKKQPLILEKKPEVVTFQICGERQQNVDDAASWIMDLILKEQSENIISDELIKSFDCRQMKTLVDLQGRKRVTFQFENNQSPPYIKISGISQDVYCVSLKVQAMIQKLKDAQEKQAKAELVYSLVEWRYQESNDTFVTFDKLTNMQLEDAKITKKTHLTVKIKKKNYKVNLNTLQANDDQGATITIQRVPKNEERQAIELPTEWEDMKDKPVLVVNLPPTSQEYQDVEKEFQKSCPNFTIEKIERVQNPSLWQAYQIKKAELDKKNKSWMNERLLFHGTREASLSLINYRGFDRGFAGKNAALIGNGTYFAAKASYSAKDEYSRPDSSGRKHMYLARVLTGKFCPGSTGLVTPPSKNTEDAADHYDSVVDNDNSPNVFVIFNDIQAYPQHLITFRK